MHPPAPFPPSRRRPQIDAALARILPASSFPGPGVAGRKRENEVRWSAPAAALPTGPSPKKNGRDPLSLEHFQCSKQRIQHFDFLNLTHFGIIAPSNVNSLRHCVPPPGALRRTSPPALDYAPFFFSHLAGVAEPTFQPLLAIVAIGRRREPSSQSSSRHIGFCNHSCQPVGPPFDIRINNCDPRAARPPPRALAPGPQIDTRRRAALVVTSFRRRTNRPAQDPPQVHRTGPGVNTLSRRGRAGSISDEGLIQPR